LGKSKRCDQPCALFNLSQQEPRRPDHLRRAVPQLARPSNSDALEHLQQELRHPAGNKQWIAVAHQELRTGARLRLLRRRPATGNCRARIRLPAKPEPAAKPAAAKPAAAQSAAAERTADAAAALPAAPEPAAIAAALAAAKPATAVAAAHATRRALRLLQRPLRLANELHKPLGHAAANARRGKGELHGRFKLHSCRT